MFLLSHTIAHDQSDNELSFLAREDRSSGAVFGGCPSLSSYYERSADFAKSEGAAQLWRTLAGQLIQIMPDCLRSGGYYALLGAAQLNSFQNAQAIESLERSLLLEPEGLAAKVDYGQALYNAGQLFPALEINDGLLGEEEPPLGLLQELEKRGELWRSDTRQNTFFLDFAGGYDNNLNGAPNLGEINLTLSGEDVSLALGDAFRSTEGAYSNFRAANQSRVLAPGYQHGWSNEVRARLSSDESSDLLRFDSHYAFSKANRSRSWQVDSGLTHLLFGGSPLFSAAQLSGRYEFRAAGLCSPTVELAGQRQYFHQQLVLNGVEGKLAGKIQCGLGEGRGSYSSLSVELGLLRNYSLRSARPGGDREGWQASVQWQSGRLLLQASQTQLGDRLGYSPILAGGAQRQVKRNQVILQFRQPLDIGTVPATWFVNFFHQNQASNISFFTARDTSLEFGLAFVF